MSLLVIRTSSMGDVIMTVPLLRSFSLNYPGEEMVFITKKPFDRFVEGIPGVRVFLSDHHGRHKGFRGLVRLYHDICKEYRITSVADLHDVIRSKVLRTFFRIAGCRIAVIDKGRKEKRQLTAGRTRKQLKHTVERYADVFEQAGYPLTLKDGPWIIPTAEGLSRAAALTEGFGRPLIGVAPRAKHHLKMWPEEKMVVMLNMLIKETGCTVYLFGSPDESESINTMAGKVPGSQPVAGKINLEAEIALISSLDIMVAMDSSNMHLASMIGVDTISIWGATHPWAGFSAWRMPEINQVQIPASELTCRPCTVYGKGECRRGDLACLEWITPEMVLKRIIGNLKERRSK